MREQTDSEHIRQFMKLPGAQDRRKFIATIGKISFYHYDFYSQALSKIERGHVQDIEDVRSMLQDGLIDPEELLRFFNAIEERLFLYPAIDPPSFRADVEAFLKTNRRRN